MNFITLQPKPMALNVSNHERNAVVKKVWVEGVPITNIPPGSDHYVHPHNPNLKLLHWHVVLDCRLGLRGNRVVVVLDTLKTPGDPVVQIEVFTRDYICSRRAADTSKSFDVRKRFTVNDVINKIHDDGYDRYHYDDNFSGCLFWTKSIIGLFQVSGYFSGGHQIAIFEEFVEHVRRNVAGVWVPPDRGRFIGR